MKRKTPEDYHQIAKNMGFEWVGEYLGDVRAKTEWRCSRGHTWFARYDAVRRHKGCPHCAGNARKVPDDYMRLGESRGFEWLGPIVTNARTKTNWRCLKGHVWATTHDVIQRGTGCPHCAGVAKKTEDDYHLLAKRRNMEWIDDEIPPNVASKSKWRCSEGHIWLGVYGHILQGIGCPHCSGLVPKTAEDYHVLAHINNHEWIADELPKDIHTVTKWRCPEGHIRETCYNNVKKFGCPQCYDMVNGSLVSKPQRELCEMINGQLNYPCGRYRIDVALPDQMIAIEYDSWFWHGDNQRHNKRDKYILAKGWKLIRIKSDSQLPSWQQLENALTELQEDRMETEIILDDWGKGQTFFDVKDSFQNKSSYCQLELF